MSFRDDDTPTHAIPMALQRKLAEASRWCERRSMMEQETCTEAGDWFESDKEAVTVLKEIVKMCEEAWGFAE